MQIMQHYIPSIAECLARTRHKQSPFSRNKCIDDIQYSVDNEQPHKKEMHGHSVRQTVIHAQNAKNPLREMNWTNTVDRIRPIDQQPAPDHQRQERKVDPVKPPNGHQVLQFEFGHSTSLRTAKAAKLLVVFT